MPQAIAFIAFGTTSTAGLTAFGIAIGTGTIGGSILSLAGSLLFSTAINALAGKKTPSQAEIKRELAYPSTLPQKRFVYGETRAVGTPIAHPVRNDYIYGCWLLSSRPSDMSSFKLFLDKREVALSGDAFDFSLAGGAVGTESPFLGHTKIWIGRGDQTSPPAEILANAPYAVGDDEELFKASDAGRGLTVIWARLNRGPNASRQERWPSTPPLVEVEGRFAKVWDPRSLAQDPDDASTWSWSANQALCTLDALRLNPFRSYANANLMLDLWKEAVEAADEPCDLKAGGTQPRYTLGGTLVFGGGEIEDLISPLLDAGASRLVRVGGKLGIVPGVWREPVRTMRNLLGDRTYSDMKSSDSVPTEMNVTYTSSQRGYESASLLPWPIPGSHSGASNVQTLNLTWVTAPQQAMRIRKIMGLRAIQQRVLSGVAPPDCFDLIGGSVVTADYPAPYGALYNTLYEIDTIHPGMDPQGTPGGDVAMRCAFSKTSTSPDIYAFNPVLEEEDVTEYNYVGIRPPLPAPGVITVATGAGIDVNTGGTVIPALRFAFDPSTTSRVTVYPWSYRINGGDWQTGGAIDSEVRLGVTGKVFGVLNGVTPLSLYDFRVEASDGYSRSNAVELYGARVDFGVTLTSSAGGVGEATFEGTTPAIDTANLRVSRSATGAGYGASTDVSGLLPVSTGAIFSVTVPSLAAGTYDFYIVPLSSTSLVGTPTSPIPLTIT